MDPALVTEIVFMSVAAILTFFSLNTLQMLARIGMEKSLFIPVMVSAAFFWYGSIINVVFRFCLESTPNLIVAEGVINLLRQISFLIGLSILTYGVFSYWTITRHVKVVKHERLQQQSSDEEEQYLVG